MKKLLLCLLTAGAMWQAQAQNDDNPTTSVNSCWKQLDGGAYLVMGIKENGTLWGWGRHFHGELGADESEYVTVPVQIGSDTDWKTVSAGNGHIMALKNNGSLWTWGSNQSGALGNGSSTLISTPIPTQVGTAQDWAYISAGGNHCAAIKTDGTLWTWGYNGSGQLGNGISDTQAALTTIPTQVGTDTDWEMVSASSDNTAAIKTDGTMWITGEGDHGSIGNGAFNDVLIFTQAGTDTDWESVSFGGTVASALKTNGTLWGWGPNFSGGVGNGTNTDVSSPVQIGTDNAWKSADRTYGYSAGAIKEDGSLWTWGYNYYGALGDGTTDNKNVPVQIASEIAWKSYHGTGDFSVALKEDGSLYVWGYNWNGALGFNIEGNTVLNPVKVEKNCEAAQEEENPPVVNDQCWKTLASGAFCTVAIKENGTLWGWGKNYSNPLGDQPEDVQTPTQIGNDNNWETVSVGNSHVVALKTDGTLWSWGRNDAGQVGNGEFSVYPVTEPLQIGTGTDWVFACAGGGLASAAIKADGTLWTWGVVNTGESLEVEDPLTLYITTPTQMGTDTNWKYVDVGHNHTAAIKTDGTLWTWGLGYHGQLGQGNNVNVYTPVQAGTDTDWKMVKASNVMTAALKTDGSLWTWGENTGGSLGSGLTTSYQANVPVQVGTDTDWKDIDLGMNYFCGAIKEDGSLWTWGGNLYGENGHPGADYLGTPTELPSDTEWRLYAGGGDFSVALKEDGTLLTWGYNWYNTLGFNIEGNVVATPLVVDVCSSTAGLNDNTLAQIVVYPNPTSSTLTLANAENLNIESLMVVDMTGKIVLSQNNNASQIDVQQLPAGMYFLRISANEGVQHLKFIKQ